MPAYRTISDRMKICKGTVSRHCTRCCKVDFVFGIVDALGTCELGLRYIFTKNQIMINDLYKGKIVCCFRTTILFYGNDGENFLKILEIDTSGFCV